MTLSEEIKNSNYVIFKSASLKEAMAAITYNRRGCIVVVDDDWTLFGVISDGDLRRAMLRGATEYTPVEKFTNLNPIVINNDDKATLESPDVFLKKHYGLNVIPVVDKNNNLVDVLVKDGFYKNNNSHD